MLACFRQDENGPPDAKIQYKYRYYMIQANYQSVIIPYRNYIGKKFNEIDEKIEPEQKQSIGVD
ncbi:hypothetical protein CW311_04670 [Acinetobacter proteolyticus]|uniref:Uncharacterized protein n=1 Tax=Acinetobacter proteolyticus TaxID=1776741 RepID=A0A2N0WHZ8_9GAMM|nr:hypothetical protein CW311_04670 [Acinetobacter proteolyticus]